MEDAVSCIPCIPPHRPCSTLCLLFQPHCRPHQLTIPLSLLSHQQHLWINFLPLHLIISFVYDSSHFRKRCANFQQEQPQLDYPELYNILRCHRIPLHLLFSLSKPRGVSAGFNFLCRLTSSAFDIIPFLFRHSILP